MKTLAALGIGLSLLLCTTALAGRGGGDDDDDGRYSRDDDGRYSHDDDGYHGDGRHDRRDHERDDAHSSCGHNHGSSPSCTSLHNNGPLPSSCAKLEGSQIGRANATLSFAGRTARITSWRRKDDSPGEYVGFTFTVEGGDFTYSVKAATDCMRGGGSCTWVHPAGTRGRDAHGISNIVFCAASDRGRDEDRCNACAGVTCTAQDSCHVAGECDPDTGRCSSPERPKGSICEDGDPDTALTTCQDGACKGPLANRPIGSVDLPPDARACRATDDGDIAYIPTGPAGMQCVHTGNPRAPLVLGRWSEPGVDCREIAKLGDVAYTACGTAGVKCVGVADPTAPFLIGTIPTGNCQHVAAFSGYLYAAVGGAVQVWDVSRPLGPVLIRTINYPFGSIVVRLIVDGGRLYVLFRTGHLVIHDLGVPGAPVTLRVLFDPMRTNATDLAVRDGIAYCGYDGAGVIIVDLRDLNAPRFLWGDGGSRIISLDARDRRLICAHADGRILSFGLRDFRSPQLLTASYGPRGSGFPATGISIFGRGFGWCSYGAIGNVLDFPPFVLQTSPIDGTSGVCSASAEVSVQFSSALDPVTVGAASIAVTGPSGAVSGARQTRGPLVTFTPAAGLLVAGRYAIAVSTSIRNLFGTRGPTDGYRGAFTIDARCTAWTAFPARVIAGVPATFAWSVAGATSARLLISTQPDPQNPFVPSFAVNGIAGGGGAFTATWIADAFGAGTTYYVVVEVIVNGVRIYGPVRGFTIEANPCFATTCAAIDQCHDAGTCDPYTGRCSTPSKADGASCNDGNACTRRDTCQAGTCTGADPVSCTASDACHLAGVCDPANGTCSDPLAANGATCDDGDPATEITTCSGGRCSGPLASQTLASIGLGDAAVGRRAIDEGDVAYVALGPDGMQCRDIADPRAPVLLGSWRQTGLDDCRELAKIGDIVYLACSASGVKCVNVANPRAPFLVGTLTTGFSASVAAYGNLLYVAFGDAVQVWDVTDPSLPILVNTLITGGRGNVIKVVVDGTRLYCLHASGELIVYDIVIGRSPSRLTILFDPARGNATDLWVIGGIAFCAYDGPGLFIIDLRNLNAPLQLYWDGGSRTIGVAVRGTTLACIYADGRYVTASIADLTRPRILSASYGPGGAIPTGVSLFRGGFAWCAYGPAAATVDIPPYVVATSPRDGSAGACTTLASADVLMSTAIDPASVTEQTLRLGNPAPVAGTRTTSGSLLRFTPASGAHEAGTYRLDVGAVRNLRGTPGPRDGYTATYTVAPACVAWTETPGTQYGTLPVAFRWRLEGTQIPAEASRVHISRTQDPISPWTRVATVEADAPGLDFTASWATEDVATTTTFYAVAEVNSGGATLYSPVIRFDVVPSLCRGVSCAAATQCHPQGTCDAATGACTAPVSPDGSFCDDGNPQTSIDLCSGGVCRGTLGAQTIGGVVFPTPSPAVTPITRRVVDDGRYAYVAVGPAGLQTLDISNPASPVLVGSWWELGIDDCQDVVKVGNYVYLACGASGMKCVDVSNPAAPILVSTIPANGGASVTVANIGNTLYVGNGVDVEIWDITNPFNPGFVRWLGSGSTSQIVRLWVDGFRVYCFYRNGLVVISDALVDAYAPVFVTALLRPGWANGTDLVVVGGILYVSFDGAGLWILDVRDVADIRVLYTDGGSRTLFIAVNGTTLACAYADGTFVTASFANPGFPRILTRSFGPGGAGGGRATGVAFFRSGYAWCAYGASAAILDIPPYVIKQLPIDGTSGVCGPGADVELFFSTAIDPATVTPSSFFVRAGGQVVPGDVAVSGNRAVFTPTAGELPVGPYEVIATGEIENLRGTSGPVDGYRGGFTIAPLCLSWTEIPGTVVSNLGARFGWQTIGGQPASTRVLISTNSDPTSPYASAISLAANGGPTSFNAIWTAPVVSAPITYFAVTEAVSNGTRLYGETVSFRVVPVPPCPAGRGDCDGNTQNGCETIVLTDRANCGACGNSCAQGQQCEAGRCEAPPVCQSGFASCDGVFANGCETQVGGTDVNNCGGCNVTCGGGICTNGACQPTVIVGGAGGGVYGLTVDDTHVYWAARGSRQLWRAQKDGSSRELLAGGYAVNDVALDASWAYFTTYDEGGLHRVPKSGGNVETLASGLRVPFALEKWGDDLFWTEFSPNFDGAVTRFSLTTGARQTISSGLPDRLGGIATDGTSHFLTRAGSAGWILRLPFAGGQAQQIADLGGYLTFTDLDQRYVYFAGSGGGVGRISKQGGQPQYFVPTSGGDTYGVAVDDRFVYWTNASNGTVNRLAKPVEGGSNLLCRAGRASCDGDASNDCEIDLTTDRANCGACGNTCAAGDACNGGVCGAPICAPGTASCDGLGANGCEAALKNDPANCGACGTTCPSGFCLDGGCVPEGARRSCLAHRNAGQTSDGYYLVDPDDEGPRAAVPVRCDMTTDGGGWMMIGRASDTNGIAGDYEFRAAMGQRSLLNVAFTGGLPDQAQYTQSLDAVVPGETDRVSVQYYCYDARSPQQTRFWAKDRSVDYVSLRAQLAAPNADFLLTSQLVENADGVRASDGNFAFFGRESSGAASCTNQYAGQSGIKYSCGQVGQAPMSPRSVWMLTHYAGGYTEVTSCGGTGGNALPFYAGEVRIREHACNDGVRDGEETGVDCGGAACGRCADGGGCREDNDCASLSCGATGVCQPATCTDGRRNGDETGRDCGGATCAACTGVTWVNPIGVSAANTANGGELVKTLVGDGWNAGASSLEQLMGEGYVETRIEETNTYRMIGLGLDDRSPSYEDIEWALYPAADGFLYIYESGAQIGRFEPYARGDLFRVEVIRGQVRYSKNGVLFWVSQRPPSFPMRADAALYSASSTIKGVKLTACTPTDPVCNAPITFINGSRVVATGTTLSRDAAADSGAGGASSLEMISCRNGYVEATATERNRTRTFGLGRDDTSPAESDIEWGIRLDASGVVSVVEGGAVRGSFGSYSTGEVFRVDVSQGLVTYLRGGVQFAQSPIATQTYDELRLDVSLSGPSASLASLSIVDRDGGADPTCGGSAFWTNYNAIVKGQSIMKQPNVGSGWDTGAASIATIAGGDGYMEFTAVETNTYRMAGLGLGDSSRSYEDIEWAIYPAADGNVYVYESGGQVGAFGAYQPGTRFRVQVRRGVVEYVRNGSVFYRSTRQASWPLRVDTALYSPGATIRDVVIVDEVCDQGQLDCDGNPQNGCEVESLADRDNCGACGAVCPNGSSCVSGACSAILSCSDTSWRDDTGRGHTGALVNFNGTANSGFVGAGTPSDPYALAFDGADDRVDIAAGSNGVRLTELTIEQWVNVDNSNQAVYSHRNDGSIYSGVWSGPWQGAWEVDVSTDCRSWAITRVTLPPANRWAHVVITVSPSGTFLYINGTQASTWNARTVCYQQGAIPRLGDAPGLYPVRGKIATTRVYAAALDANEVQSRYRELAPRFGISTGQPTAQITKPIELDLDAGSCRTPPAGALVGEWRLNEGQGTAFADASGNGHNGTLTHPAAWGRGYDDLGSGLFLSGSNPLLPQGSHGQVPHSDALSPASTLTVTAWIKPRVSQLSGIAAKGARGGPRQDWGLYANGAEIAAVFNYDGSTDSGVLSSSGAALPIGQWSYVAMVFDRPNVRFYKNGRFVSQTTYANALLNQGTMMVIGTDAGNPNDFDGNVDEVRVYGAALTQLQLQSLYGYYTPVCAPGRGNCNGDPSDACEVDTNSSSSNCGACGVTCAQGQTCTSGQCVAVQTGPAPAYWWPAEGNGNDISGNRPGTIAGVTFAPGKVGQAFQFDGRSSHLGLDRLPLVGYPGITFSAWVNTVSQANTTHYPGNPALTLLGDSTNSVWIGFGVHGGRARYTKHTTQWNEITGTRAVADGTWHHIAVTHDEVSGVAILYVDGVADGTATIDFRDGVTAIDRIGTGYQDMEGFDGLADEIKVFTRVLTPAEIAIEAQATLGSNTTWNPQTAGASIVLSNGNLTVSGTDGGCGGGVRATTSRTSGKWYWEATAQQDGGGSATACPVRNGVVSSTGELLNWYGFLGTLYGSTVSCSGSPGAVNSGDVVGVALDLDALQVGFYRNNTRVLTCAIPQGTWFPYANHCNDAGFHCASTANFGNAPFRYTPPQGFSPLP